MPLILLTPIIPFFMNVVFMGFVVMTMAFLYASGEIKKDASTGQGSVEFNETLQYMMTYTLFGMLWGLQFIAGVGLMTTARSIAERRMGESQARHIEKGRHKLRNQRNFAARGGIIHGPIREHERPTSPVL